MTPYRVFYTKEILGHLDVEADTVQEAYEKAEDADPNQIVTDGEQSWFFDEVGFDE